MARLEMLEQSGMSLAQKQACEAVTAGPRGKIPMPMTAWLRNPELAMRAQHLGALLRFDTTLDAKVTELAILVCARHWTSHLEWTAHKRLALEAGLPAEVITALAERRGPNLEDDVQRAVYAVARELMASGRLSDDTYQVGAQQLGTTGMVELVALLGYYTLVALTLNAFELGLPEQWAPELEDRSTDCAALKASAT